jgi:hypothetical protein
MTIIEPNPYRTESWRAPWTQIKKNDTTSTNHTYFASKPNSLEVGKKDNDLPPCAELQEYQPIEPAATFAVGVKYLIDIYVAPDPIAHVLRYRFLRNNIQIYNDLDKAKFAGNPNSCLTSAEQQPFIGTGWQQGGQTGQGTSPQFLNSNKTLALYAEACKVQYGPKIILEPFSF